MAIAIPEVAAAAGEATAGAGEAGAAGGARAARGPRGIRGPQGPAAVAGGGQQDRGKQARERGRKAARDLGRARVPGNRSYQPVILAEFLVATVLVAVSPVASGGDATAKAKGGPSPYSTDTMKQLVAIGGVYFVLALMSGSRKLGRFSAWFGALVLLGLGFAKLASGDLQAIFGIFGPGGGPAKGGNNILGPSGINPQGVNAPPLTEPGQGPGQIANLAPPPGGTGTITTDTGTALA